MAKSTMFLRSFLLLLAILSSGAADRGAVASAAARCRRSRFRYPLRFSASSIRCSSSACSSFTGRSKVIVRAASLTSIGPVRLLVQQLGGVLGRQLPLIESVVADVPNISLPLLANSPLVKRVALDRLILGATERTGATVGATAVRQAYGL